MTRNPISRHRDSVRLRADNRSYRVAADFDENEAGRCKNSLYRVAPDSNFLSTLSIHHEIRDLQ